MDLDLPFTFLFCVAATFNAYSNLGVLAAITWQVLFVSIPMVYIVIRLQVDVRENSIIYLFIHLSFSGSLLI